MDQSSYESTLNTWLAELLQAEQLDAKPESKHAGGKRLDVEINQDGVCIALEAEQGQSKAKRAAAIQDADSRLRDDLAHGAVAICYPDGLHSREDLARAQILYTLRTLRQRPAAAKTAWQSASISQLAGVIRQIPQQLGDPDEIAKRLSFSLDRAVARLREGQKQDLAACLDLPAGKATKAEFSQGLSSRYNQAAKRALLVVATAVMFHSQLDNHRHELQPRAPSGGWPPARASQCADSNDPVGAFYTAWGQWLQVDYKPIFATARNALQTLAGAQEFADGLRIVARSSLQVTRNIVGLRHDLLGRIFHKVLDSARYDGSFYTTTAAATLLANLAIGSEDCDWGDPSAIARFRVTDPACGTGTLLMAAAERIRDLSRARGTGDVSRRLIENVLTGYDVNLTATHLAATTLGLLSPRTTFEKMKIYRALLGVENGEAKLGSLEFLSGEKERQPRLLPWPTGVEQVESGAESTEAEPADLVIMNPPFTRSDLRHDQFSRQEEKMLKAREKELLSDLADGAINRSHNGSAFLALADFIAKDRRATIAVILPLVGATNVSTKPMRVYLAKQFHIDTIVTSHDPTRIYFSENTNIGEMLLICRRIDAGNPPPPTTIVNLYENPATPVAALGLARELLAGRYTRIKGTVQEWPAQRIKAGDWGGVQFLSPYLCETFFSMRESTLFPAEKLGKMAFLIRTGDPFRKSEVPDRYGMRALWYHKTDITQKMLAQTDTYILPKTGQESRANEIWKHRSMLMLTRRLFLPTFRCMAVRLDEPAVGSSWIPCHPRANAYGRDLLEKACCAFLNSTIGILAILGCRTNKKPTYPSMSMNDWRAVPMPDFDALSASQVSALAAAYDALCKFTLLPLPRILQDETRHALDRIVTEALGIAPEIVATIRRELAREPSVTNRLYEG